MGQDGIPLSIGIVLAAAIFGAMVLAGMVISALLSM